MSNQHTAHALLYIQQIIALAMIQWPLICILYSFHDMKLNYMHNVISYGIGK